jgi:hypothetical protein
MPVEAFLAMVRPRIPSHSLILDHVEEMEASV